MSVVPTLPPVDAPGEADLDRVLTLPNAVSLARLAGVPLFVWLLFGAHDHFAAAVVLAAVAGTDWVDGFMARRLGQVSTLGKVLDPTADRVLVATAVVSIAVDGSMPVWLAGGIALREALVSGAVLLLAAMGAARIDVLWIGKLGTLLVMAALPLFLASHAGLSWSSEARSTAWALALPGLAVAYYAAACYLPVARRALVAGRVRSAP